MAEAAARIEAVLAVAAAVVGANWLVARFSGWSTLAERHPEPRPASVPAATRFGYLLFRGWFAYKGCVVVSADAEGLHLRCWWPFSLFHAPIFLSWRDISGVEKTRQFLIAHRRLRLSRCPELDFALREGTYQDVAAAFRAAGVPGAD